MKIGVLIKQVPATESALHPTSDQRWVEETALAFEMNESDSYALEEALLLRERTSQIEEIVVVTLGPQRSQKVLREALAKGADRGIHILASASLNLDPYSIAATFKAAVEGEHFDLIFSGLQSFDLGFGQTGIILGELLGMSTASLAVETQLRNGHLRVKRELESGWTQWVTLPLPASVTIQSGLNHPRYPSLKGIMGAKKKEVKTFEQTDLYTEQPLQTIGRLYIHKKDKRTEIIEGDTDQIVTQLVDVFKSKIKAL